MSNSIIRPKEPTVLGRCVAPLFTFTTEEARAISYYLQRVTPRGDAEEQELVKLIQSLSLLLSTRKLIVE